MHGQVDISGRIDEWKKHSYLAFATDKKQHIVFIDTKTKGTIRKKFGNITDFVQKFHCLMIYYCIRDSLDNFESLQICPDCGTSKIYKYLKDYFYNNQKYDKIKKNKMEGSYNKPTTASLTVWLWCESTYYPSYNYIT